MFLGDTNTVIGEGKGGRGRDLGECIVKAFLYFLKVQYFSLS